MTSFPMKLITFLYLSSKSKCTSVTSSEIDTVSIILGAVSGVCFILLIIEIKRCLTRKKGSLHQPLKQQDDTISTINSQLNQKVQNQQEQIDTLKSQINELQKHIVKYEDNLLDSTQIDLSHSFQRPGHFIQSNPQPQLVHIPIAQQAPSFQIYNKERKVSAQLNEVRLSNLSPKTIQL